MIEQTFKNGDIVVITKYNNSSLNIYKGYITNVVKCFKNNITICIGTYTGPKVYDVPSEHLIHLTNSYTFQSNKQITET